MSKNIIGVESIQKLFDDCYNAPAKVLTRAAKRAAKIALDYAKRNVPKSSEGQKYGKYPHPPGNLAKSLRLKAEKRKKGKRVYTIGPSKDGWYAHFMDSGFFATGSNAYKSNKIYKLTREKQTQGMKWVPGNGFLRNSIDHNRSKIKDVILDELGKELDKLK